MTDYKMAWAGDEQYVAPGDDTKKARVWIVYVRWPTGKIDRDAAYFSEKLARAHAAKLVGVKDATIGLESVQINDIPPEKVKP
jgi:hypothetical protein